MKAETVDLAQVMDALEALRREVARLGERVAALEAAAPSPPGPLSHKGERGSQTDLPPLPSVGEGGRGGEGDKGISEEIILVISAAVAAFLGKKPRIRQIRLLGSAAWAQQGRVTIQASHALAGQTARSPL